MLNILIIVPLLREVDVAWALPEAVADNQPADEQRERTRLATARRTGPWALLSSPRSLLTR